MAKKKKMASAGVNQKAAAARQRKANTKQAKQAAAAAAAEDAKWAAAKAPKSKAQLKREQAAAAAAAKAERRAAIKEKERQEEEELARISKRGGGGKTKPTTRDGPSKLTQFQIRKRREAEAAERKRQEEEAARKAARIRILQGEDDLLKQNPNLQERDQRERDLEQFGEGGVIEASSVGEAIRELSIAGMASGGGGGEDDGEARIRFPQYFKDNLARAKEEWPGLKDRQLKDKLYKEYRRMKNNQER